MEEGHSGVEILRRGIFLKIQGDNMEYAPKKAEAKEASKKGSKRKKDHVRPQTVAEDSALWLLAVLGI